MSAEARYFRVGAFVFTGLVAIVAFTLVLGGQDLFQEKVLMETYFEESVQGLDVGSPVKLRGVTLGQVSQIGFLSDFYDLTEAQQLEYGSTIVVLSELIRVRQDITEAQRRNNVEQLIGKGLRMRLTTLGLTGTSFVQADFLDAEVHPPMEIAWQPHNLYVPSAPSTMATITSAAERIFRKLEDAEIDQVVANMDKLLITLRTGIDDMHIRQLSRSAQQTLDELNATIARVQRAVDGGTYDFQASLANLRVASENLRDLTETAKAYPSYMLLGKPPKPAVSAK